MTEMLERQVEDLDGDPLADLEGTAPEDGVHTQLNGSYTIWGPVAVSYELLSAGKVQVCLTLAGVKVRCVTVDWQKSPSVTLSGNNLLAKGHLTLTLVNRRRLTYKGTACVWVGSWRCKRVQGTVIEF